jgi:hypothetical protein
MARTVLLIEPDVDELGVLASKLRARGLEVWIADGMDSALSRARRALPDVVLASDRLEQDPERARGEVPGLGNLPWFRLVDEGAPHDSRSLSRSDAEVIARRVHALPTRSQTIVPEASDFRGDLAQVSVVDLIQLLSSNRRSGVLTLQTPLGTGEVRFVDGEVLDALYRRLEGRKALYRLLAEREGAFSFMVGAGAPLLRRIDDASHLLLMDGIRELDESQELVNGLDLGDDTIVALVQPAADTAEVPAMILAMLVTPRTLSELLDDVPAMDLEILRAVALLLRDGSLRRIAGGSRRVELADPDRLGVLAALSKRIMRAGFRDGGRVAIAASPRRLLSVAAAFGRIAEAMMPTEAVPGAPIPHLLSTLRLGDSVDLDVLGIPLVEAYAPFWAVVLPGCSALALLDEGPRATLDHACQIAGVPVLDASSMIGPSEEADPEIVALLVQRALENATGA